MNITEQLEQLQNFIEKEQFRGWDPYDALNSPIIRVLSLNQKYPRMIFTQIMRRCSINFRPLLLCKKGYNPKGLGLFLEGYSRLPKTEHCLKQIDTLLELLEKQKSTGYSGNCWGYNFDWQSKAAFVPKYTPTIVNSAFIGHALLDAFEYAGRRKALDMALSIKDFLLNDLNRKSEGGSFCFSYTPVDNNYVHNASLMGASLLIRLSRFTNDTSLVNPAMEALAYSMKYQHDDGSWYYAERDIQNWVDSFHTGFNLEAVRRFIRAGHMPDRFMEGYKLGIDYYAKTFFLADGTPKYFNNATYPIDIHSPMEAICFFSGEGEKYSELTDRVLNWALENMWDSKKHYFYFRIFKGYKNKIQYIRWSTSWAWRAINHYAYNKHLINMN